MQLTSSGRPLPRNADTSGRRRHARRTAPSSAKLPHAVDGAAPVPARLARWTALRPRAGLGTLRRPLLTHSRYRNSSATTAQPVEHVSRCCANTSLASDSPAAPGPCRRAATLWTAPQLACRRRREAQRSCARATTRRRRPRPSRGVRVGNLQGDVAGGDARRTVLYTAADASGGRATCSRTFVLDGGGDGDGSCARSRGARANGL